MCAIVGALQSNVVSRLDITHKAMSNRVQRRYQKLTAFLDSNYTTYRTAVHRDNKRGCVPWHDAHLHDIEVVLLEEDVEDHHEAPLLNFEKWTHLKDKALDATRYRDIPLTYDEDGFETAMAYLTQQLQSVLVDGNFSRRLQNESARLKHNEETMRRVAASRSVGFN